MKSPRVLVFSNFLSDEDWKIVDRYCRKNGNDFEFIGYSNLIHYKTFTHSTRKDISYQRSFLSSEEDNGSVRHGDNYKVYMVDLANTSHKLYEKPAAQVLQNMLFSTQATIEDIYGVSTMFESGPWLTKAPIGGYMNLHCDGTFIANPDKNTDFSSVYYVNDDYEGGELVIPVLGITIKPQANSLVIWSDVTHEDMAHGVTAITKGNRYVSQGFFATT